MSETQGNFDLALNRLDHDMNFHESLKGSNKVAIWPINGADKVAQQIKINLLTFLGEWFLDETWGVPYLEDILIKNPRMPSVETILRDHINSVFHVIKIESFGMGWDRRRRTLNVEFEAITDFGPIRDSVKLEIPRANV
jgi:hypothetical protein